MLFFCEVPAGDSEEIAAGIRVGDSAVVAGVALRSFQYDGLTTKGLET